LSKSCDAVAAVHDDAQRTRDLSDARRDVLHVFVDHRNGLDLALAGGKASLEDQPVQLLDFIAVERGLADAELEPVVLGWVVRARDLDAARHRQVVQAPVEQRRGDDADVEHVQPRLGERAHERFAQHAAARPIVAPNGHRSMDVVRGQIRRVRAA
jgi:hypothetical protein